MRAHRFAGLLLLALALPACSHTAPQSVEKGAPPTVLRVDNESTYDMVVFISHEGGNDVRLGSVSGNHTAHLTIPSGLIVGLSRVRFVARPLPGQAPGLGASAKGGLPLEFSETRSVAAGDTVKLTILVR